MKPEDIRELTDEELAKAIQDNRKELFHLRMQLQTGQLDNSGSIRQVRRDVARLKTEEKARVKKGQTVKSG
ncbi:MAG: 50S ribosomal protein L29 [Verrucomicrobiota bacterium]